MVTGPGIERNEGMLGFDWVTHKGDPQAGERRHGLHRAPAARRGQRPRPLRPRRGPVGLEARRRPARRQRRPPREHGRATSSTSAEQIDADRRARATCSARTPRASPAATSSSAARAATSSRAAAATTSSTATPGSTCSSRRRTASGGTQARRRHGAAPGRRVRRPDRPGRRRASSARSRRREPRQPDIDTAEFSGVRGRLRHRARDDEPEALTVDPHRRHAARRHRRRCATSSG